MQSNNATGPTSEAGPASAAGLQPAPLADDAFALAVVLYLAYEKTGELLPSMRAVTALTVPPGLRRTVERHQAAARRPAALRFADAAGVKAFADLKRDEAAGLRAQAGAMGAAAAHYHAEAGAAVAQQRHRPSAAGEMAMRNLRMVRHAAAVLPVLATRAEGVEAAVRARLAAVRRKKKDLTRVAELRALAEREASLEAWADALVPSSEVYARTERERRAADERLLAFRREHPEAAAVGPEDEARLEAEYRELLVFTADPVTVAGSGGDGEAAEKKAGDAGGDEEE